MNEEKRTPSVEKLTRFVDGQLSDAETEELLLQLADDEESLRKVDELWSTQPLQAIVSDIAEIDTESSQRVQRRLIREINRSKLAANVVRLGTSGFLAVAASLLKPLLASSQPYRRQEETGLDRNTQKKGKEHD